MQRRTVGGLALLGALLLCVVFAQSAGAVWTQAKNLTAFTCVKGAGNLDFSDSHCDKAVTAGTGEYGHVAIPVGKTTEAETINTTPAVLVGIVAGAPIKITCKTARATGTFQNEEPSSKVHTGKAVGTSTFSECTVNEPAGCKTSAKLTTKSTTGLPVENGSQMGGELKPTEAGGTFLNIPLSECAAEGTYPVKGSAIAVGAAGATAKGTGSTAVYSPEGSAITLGTNPASVTVTTTVRTVVGGIPLAGTTVT